MCNQDNTPLSAYVEARIIETIKLTDEIVDLTLRREDGKPFAGKPGQFVMIKPQGRTDMLGRPISIARLNSDGTLRLLVRQAGKISKALYDAQCNSHWLVFGPLGHGFELKAGLRTALVGGGIGIAPLLELAVKLQSTGQVKPDIFLGYRDEPYATELFSPLAHEFTVMTEHGASCKQGLITEACNLENYDIVYACGPDGLLQALWRQRPDNVEMQLSLERKMACGYGVCLGCIVATQDGGNKRACADGPVFDAKELVYA